MSADKQTAWTAYVATRLPGDVSRKAAFDAAWDSAIAAERERCAQLAEHLDRQHGAAGITGSAIADRIRGAESASVNEVPGLTNGETNAHD